MATPPLPSRSTASSSSPAAPWLLLQLTDGTFPAGGFAHSGGLEAGARLGGRVDVRALLVEALWQAGRGTLPFVVEASRDASAILALDLACDATLTSHVKNRASRAQGRALASAARRIFEETEAVGAIGEHAKARPAHHPVVFGALFGALGFGERDAAVAWLHTTARGLLSAAVRLGLVGPLEAARVHAEAAGDLEAVVTACERTPALDAAQTAPLLELFGALHDTLDGRMFQS